MYFSFVLRQKKRYQKKNSRLHFRSYSGSIFSVKKGRLFERSEFLPFLTLKILPTFDAPTVRPGTIRGDSAEVMV